jgi:hypothetical protein
MKRAHWITLGLCVLLTGCGLFDSGVVWRGGPYVLSWIDLPEEVTLSYDLGKGASVGRIEERVFAVGWDGRYLVAKQHPRGDRKITNFYIVDAQKDGPYADPKKVVIGPLSEVEFKKKSEELSLPPFTKELASLK